MQTSIWYGCYDEMLKAFITPASFAHPAKMAKHLCERIYEHGAEQGYWQPCDLILDPFGGIGTTGLIGAYRGYRVISIELEPHFFDLHQANLKKNTPKLKRLGLPIPIVIQGDSRFASRLVSEAIGSIFPPPYAHSVHDGNGIDQAKLTGNPTGKTSQALNDGYGETAGQIGALREGQFESVIGAITSPPWEDTLSRDVVNAEARRDYARAHGISNAEHVSPVDMERIGARDQEYGKPPGQIGTLTGGFDEVMGAITSPPYEASVNQSAGANDSAARLDRKAQAGVDVSQAVKRGGPNSVLNQPQVYGETEGQIGSKRSENYWQAMAQVYAELYRVLRPGGVAAIVVKDFVRNKQIVPLCDRTAQLLEALGFTIIERTHAMLTRETPLGLDMFTGTHASKTTSRKSFFRRLAEKNGSPAIDYEEVIWAQR